MFTVACLSIGEKEDEPVGKSQVVHPTLPDANVGVAAIKRHRQKLIPMMLTPSEQAAGEFTPKMKMMAVVVRSCGHSRATSITVQNKQVHWRGNDIDIEEQPDSSTRRVDGSRLKGQSPIWLMETRQNASGGRCAHIDRQVTFQSLGQETIFVVQLAWQWRIDANSRDHLPLSHGA
jgi:hypothetical protein